jgi:hypothetical protein
MASSCNGAVAGEEIAPIRLDRFVAPPGGERLDLVRIESADRFENGLVLEVEEIGDFAKSVGVSPAHKAVADESDIEFFHRCSGVPIGKRFGPLEARENPADWNREWTRMDANTKAEEVK